MTGVYIIFKMEQSKIRTSIKHQIKSGIPENELHVFSLSVEEYQQLNWVRKDKEFSLQTNMYDIVRKQNTKDSIFLFCVNDKEEAVLFARLDEMVKKSIEHNSNSSDNPLNNVVKLFKLLYVIEDTRYFFNEIGNIVTTNFGRLKFHYVSPYLEQLTPPPDKV